MATGINLTEAEWTKKIDEWHEQQVKDLGTVTVPEIGLSFSEVFHG